MSMSKLHRWVNESPERAREYARESLIVAVSEEIFAALEASGFTRAELAEKLGTSKSHITQLLNGARNMTLRSLADISFALNLKPCFKLLKANEYAPWIEQGGFIVRRPQIALHITSVMFDESHQKPACNEPNWVDIELAANAA